MPERLEVVGAEPTLNELASSIHEHQAKGRAGIEAANEARFAIGRDLLAARRQLPSNKAFGEWVDGQGFGFTRQWANRLRQAAEDEQRVRGALESQLSNGHDPNIEKAVTELRRADKEAERQAKRDDNAELIEQSSSLDTALDSGARFSTIVIDPPWDFGDEGDVDQLGRGRPTYQTMSVDEIAALPLGEHAADDAHLYLWITNRSLPKGFALLDGWGFRYVTCLTWVKPSFGMGNYFRGSTEQVLFGVRGALPLARKDAGTHFEAPRGPDGHSSKPSEFYDLVRSCSPGPRLDYFGRREIDGFTVFGEAGVLAA